MTHHRRPPTVLAGLGLVALVVVGAVGAVPGSSAATPRPDEPGRASVVAIPHGGLLVRSPHVRPELTTTLLVAVAGPDVQEDQIAGLRTALERFRVKVWSVTPPTGDGTVGAELRGADAEAVVPGIDVTPPPEPPSDAFEVAARSARAWALGTPLAPGEGRAVAVLAGREDIESVRRALTPDGSAARAAVSFEDAVRPFDAVGTFVPDLDAARSAPFGAGGPLGAEPGAPPSTGRSSPGGTLPPGRSGVAGLPTTTAARLDDGPTPTTVVPEPTAAPAGGSLALRVGVGLLAVAGIGIAAFVVSRRRRGAKASRGGSTGVTAVPDPMGAAADGDHERRGSSPSRRLVHLGLAGGVASGSKEEHTMSSSSPRVEPRTGDSTCTWSLERAGTLGIGLWLEQRSGQGEDAAPTILVDPQADDVLVAVYDGVGGAGSAPGRERPDGTTVSSAFLAARRARSSTESWFGGLDPASDGPPGAMLHEDLLSGLEAERAVHLPVSTRIAGSMRRLLPTTLAAVRAQADDGGRRQVSAFWAGDSRGYVLKPTPGLQVLTVDDTPTIDALEALVNDAPLSNMVCADRPFEVHERSITSDGPLVILAATDGCFGYLATPAHFELLLLQSLQRSADVDEWSRRLLASVKAVAADDASLGMLALGWGSFADLRSAFATRAHDLEVTHGRPFEGLEPGDRTRLVAAREESWERYRGGYHEHVADAMLAGVAEGGGSRAPG